MFKIFHGYDLVESYHNWKKSIRTDKKTVSRAIRLIVAIVAALVVWCLPVENWIDGMTIIQKRTLAIFLFAILMWLFEAVPAWTTSVMVVVLLLFTTSNSSLVFFENAAPELLGAQTSYKSLLHCFADPIIMLFIGGFVLAIAASKTGLDLFLARVMLKPFGKKPQMVLLGFLMVTGVFSMFLSNTATAAMMLTFLALCLLGFFSSTNFFSCSNDFAIILKNIGREIKNAKAASTAKVTINIPKYFKTSI